MLNKPAVVTDRSYQITKADGIVQAVRFVAATGGVRSLLAIIPSLAISALLASIGYADGALPLVGAALVGALAPAVLISSVGLGTGATVHRIQRVIASMYREFPLHVLAVSCILPMTFAFGSVVAHLPGSEAFPTLASIMNNQLEHWWKPVAHTSLMTILVLGVSPALIIAVPVSLKSGCDLKTSYFATREQSHNKDYGMWDMHWVLVGIALIGLVPIVGVIAVPMAVGLSVWTYRRVFSRV